MAHKRFTLTRGTPDEMDEMARLQWECFPPFARQKFMGCQTEADLPQLAARARDDMRANVHDIWIMVRDPQAGGRLAAASNWRIYLNEAAAQTCDDRLPPGLAEGGGDPEAREKAARMMDEMNAGRKKANPHGFLHLHICFTSPDYRRKGAGSLMMKWGCDLADQLGLPGWIEASPEGNYLYKVFGFYDVGKMGGEGEMSGTFMRRDAPASLGGCQQ